jgi:hypothetical protein
LGRRTGTLDDDALGTDSALIYDVTGLYDMVMVLTARRETQVWYLRGFPDAIL